MKHPSPRTFAKRLAALAGVLALPLLAQAAHFSVTLNTSSLIGNPAGPFYVGFQLADGSLGGDGNNAVFLNNFQLGGGTAIPPGCNFGSTSGDLSTTITLTDLGIFAVCTERITPGNTLSFDVNYTTNLETYPGPADEFVMVILGGNFTPIATTGGFALFQIDFDSANPTVQVFAGDPSAPQGGLGIAISAPVLSGFSLPPPAPVLVSPADGATGVSLSPSLTWNAATGAASYDVYFGTASTPPFVGNTTGTSYSAGTPALNTVYYWRVVAKGSAGDTSSATSSFTTVVTPPFSPFNVGVFRFGFFWLEDVDGNQQFNSPPDRAFAFGGVPGDIAITGDWNGNGYTRVGIYRPSNGLFILDSNGNAQFDAGDAVYNLGVGTQPGDIPVVGDWNGDGRSKVGLFRQGYFWILDYNGNGVFDAGIDKTYAFGGVGGDVPVVGDWSGSGTTKIGLFRQGFFWILDYNGNGSLDAVNQAGGDKAFAYGGISGDVPVVGDWNGDGKSKVGVFRSGFFWVLDANGNYQFDGVGAGNDLAFPFGGISGDKPVMGKW